MKLNQIKTKTLTGASAAALDTAVAAWVQATGEATFLAIAYQVDAGTYSVLITYTL
jgi:hypothetical protein